MQRHELDPVSLFAGLVFPLVAGAYALTHTTGIHLHWLLVVPAGLILVGAVILSMAVRRLVRPRLAVDSTGDVQTCPDRPTM